MNYYGGQFVTFIESIATDVIYRIVDDYGGQAAATFECLVSNGRYCPPLERIRDNDGGIVVIFVTRHKASSIIVGCVLHALFVCHGASEQLFNFFEVLPVIGCLIGRNTTSWYIERSICPV